ncbi:MAG: hypothetical protein ACFFB3_15770 [Candidatus Hodarchaeota archaeon]
MTFHKRILIQKNGISATHPILAFFNDDETIVCSIASQEGNSSFDYSLILLPNVLAQSMSDDEAISVICRSENHKQSAWGWELAIKHGLPENDIQEVFPLIDIPDPRKIRLSRATREAQKTDQIDTKSG